MCELAIEHLVAGGYRANAYLVRLFGREDAFLVDPGDDYALIADAIQRSGLRVTDILLTHGHFDHTLSAARIAALTGARVHIHPLDAIMLTDPAAALYDAGNCSGAFRPVCADAPFEVAERARIELCGVAIDLIHCPGHTPGGMSFYCPDHAAVFTGDTLFVNGVGRTDFPGGDPRQLWQSLQKLLSLPPETVAYPGHGHSARVGRIAEDFQ